MIVSVVTFIVGALIGYLGQRSAFCIISGIRDFFFIKNTYRLRGLLGVIIGGVIGYTAFSLIGGDVPEFPLGIETTMVGIWVTGIIGGIGLGFWSVLAEGCPFRQHVMAAEGREGARFYLFGFYIGIVFFFMVTIHWLELALQLMS